MSNEFYTLIRFMGKVVASIVVLVAVVGGTISYLEIGNDTSSVAKVPEVKFSDFEKYKNMKTKTLSKKELRALRDKFQENFFKKHELISKNISIYATATKQPIPQDEALEELLFTIVSKYSYDMRASYLSQLVSETSNLVSYSEVIATDKTKSNIQWTDFLDWFTADFNYQLDGSSNETQYITIEASTFEKSAIAGMVIIVIMLGIMMFILLRRDAKANPVSVTPPVKAKEPVKTPTPAKVTPVKAQEPAKKTEAKVETTTKANDAKGTEKKPVEKKPVEKKAPATKDKK